MALEEVVEAAFELFAANLHWLVQAVLMELGLVHAILEVVTILLHMLGVERAAQLVIAGLEAFLTDLGECLGNLFTLVQHGTLVGVEPTVPLRGSIQISGSALVRFPKVVRRVVLASQGRVVAALERNRLRAGVVGHLDVENVGYLASDLGGLAQEHVRTTREGAALNAEATARLHLPEEADLAVLLRQDPDAEQVSAGHEGLVEVVPGLPGALGAGKLGDGGVDSAHLSVLVDPQVHAAGLVVVGVRDNLLGLGSAKHSGFDGLLDERNLAAGDGDPTAVKGVGLGHVAWLREAGRPRQRAAGQLERLVAVVEALAQLDLLLGQLWARLGEVLEAQRLVVLCLADKRLAELFDLRAKWVSTEGPTEAAISILASKLMRLKEVVEAGLVGLAAGGVRLVEALAVKLGPVQPTLERILIEVRHLSCIQSASMSNPARLQSRFLAEACVLRGCYH
mmetsp:Transcript_4127/g.12873  ORF Transcript_4127/g.12873 Transcript_4127/m.12873 type:complete len:453 (+) Transcript_4127:219-1577(+)